LELRRVAAEFVLSFLKAPQILAPSRLIAKTENAFGTEKIQGMPNRVDLQEARAL